MVDNVVPLLSEKRTRFILRTLLCLLPIIGMAVDLVAPSLPAITASLHVSTSFAKNIISIYILGYALGNFFTGFLTDALGRKKLLRLGLCAFMLASLAPVLFPHIEVLLLARFLQGITLGAVAVLLRSICSDILPAEKLVHLGTLLGTMFSLGPVIGPIIGGYLQAYFGWKAGFLFFSLAAFFMLIAVWVTIPETHFNRHPLHINTMKKNLMAVLSHRLFMSLTILMGLMYSLVIVFNTSGPFLIQTRLHYSPIFFGHLAFYLGLSFLFSTFCCRFFLKYFKMEKMLLGMINTLFVLSFFMVLASYFFTESITLVTISSAFIFFGCGFIFPMSMGKGLTLFRPIVGTASATMYLGNMLITSLVSFIISFIHIGSTIPLMWIYFALILTSMFVYWRLIHRD